MENRRLDNRFDKGEPYAMALPSPKTTLAARFYRPILTILQCVVVLIPWLILIQKDPLNLSRYLLPSIFTLGYISIYLGRLLVKQSLGKTRWQISQIIIGFSEIIILIILDMLYILLHIEHEGYWWALFILPVYRLAEVSGYEEWVASLAITSVWLIGKSLLNPLHSKTSIDASIAQVLMFTLLTFIPYYIFHVLDLHNQAANFWYPLALRFIKTPLETSDGKELLNDVFLRGMANLITADFAKLWELDIEQNTLVLNTVYEYKSEPLAKSFWHKWVHDRKPTIVSTTESAILADPVIREQKKMALDQIFVAHSRNNPACQIDLPWHIRKSTYINSWLVAPIYIGKIRRPVGYLEVGKYDNLDTRRWQVMESQMIAITEVLGAVYRRIQQVQANTLIARLIDLEQEAPDEAALYALSSKAMLDYFYRRVLIVNYSLATGKIETYAGDYEPEKVEQLANSLHNHEQELLRLEETDIHLIPGQPSQSDQDFYFVCRLNSRKTQIEAIVLVDFWDQLVDHDQQVLRDSARIISAAIARRRAATLLQPDMGSNSDSLAIRRRLFQLAEEVKQETSANVVVLYEFENEKPKLSPIVVGDLRKPKYLEKPIVIEEPNPIIKISRTEKPEFHERIQLTPMGNGLNRHGDDVFAVREGIISSVALPLKVDQRLVGIMWINFRDPQTFDRSRRAYYQALFRELPRRLQTLRFIEIARSLGEQQTRDELHADLHDHVLQDIIAAGGFTSTARIKIQEQSPPAAIENLSKALKNLENAETGIRTILDNLPGLSCKTNLGQYLVGFVERLQEECNGLPQDLRTDGLDAIPPTLYDKLYPIFEEAIRNAAKHGRASRVVIQISNANSVLDVIIRDNGGGFEPKPEHYGTGIKGMLNRVRWSNGKMKITSKEGKGTSIILEIPIPTEDIENG